MKRYHINSTVTVTRDPHHRESKIIADNRMTEAGDGEWVRWEDVRDLIRPPDERLDSMEKTIHCLTHGLCRVCGKKVDGHKAPTGLFAPEAYAALRELGIDPTNGHALNCPNKKKP